MGSFLLQEQVKESNWVQWCLCFPILFPPPQEVLWIEEGCKKLGGPVVTQEYLGLPSRARSTA